MEFGSLGIISAIIAAVGLLAIVGIWAASKTGVLEGLSWITNAVTGFFHIITRIFSYAPRFLQVTVFVLISGAMLGLLTNWIMAADVVCDAGTPYQMSFMGATMAKMVTNNTNPYSSQEALSTGTYGSFLGQQDNLSGNVEAGYQDAFVGSKTSTFMMDEPGGSNMVGDMSSNEGRPLKEKIGGIYTSLGANANDETIQQYLMLIVKPAVDVDGMSAGGCYFKYYGLNYVSTVDGISTPNQFNWQQYRKDTYGDDQVALVGALWLNELVYKGDQYIVPELMYDPTNGQACNGTNDAKELYLWTPGGIIRSRTQSRGRVNFGWVHGQYTSMFDYSHENALSASKTMRGKFIDKLKTGGETVTALSVDPEAGVSYACDRNDPGKVAVLIYGMDLLNLQTLLIIGGLIFTLMFFGWLSHIF